MKLKFVLGVLISLLGLPTMLLSQDVSAIIEQYARTEHIDPLLVKSIIYHESRGNARALSHVGAMGLMQVMPGTAKFVGADPSKLYVPEENIKAGVRYLSFLQRSFRGDVIKMVAAYNAGHGAVIKYNGVPPYKETIGYTRNVLDTYQKFKGGSGWALVVKEVNPAKPNTPKKPREQQFLVVIQDNSTVASNKGAYSSASPGTRVKGKDKNIRAVSDKKNSESNKAPIVNSPSNTKRNNSFVQIVSGS